MYRPSACCFHASSREITTRVLPANPTTAAIVGTPQRPSGTASAANATSTASTGTIGSRYRANGAPPAAI
ncbi:hypothetical protein [Frankia canadensis]|uniref:hypothetical protein n=1 Tax=Frankia canadensis TaxID=1836972 RepID=UPI000C7B3617|nr:hypothetical protein [Frankia canadensis]